jgi:peptide/nickel transport system permease protein
MARFLLRRALRTIAAVLGVLTIVFFIVRINGNPALLLLGPNATPTAVANLDHALGLDRSVPVQYVSFLRSALAGNFGNSIQYHTSAIDLILQRLPATLTLAFSAFGFGIVLAFVLSLATELWDLKGLRNAVLWIGAIIQAVPTFLLGVMMILVFAVELKVLPALGDNGPSSLVMPVVTLGCFEVALYVRLFTVAFLEQEAQDYVRTAYAKGRTKLQVTVQHILPNAILPVITVAGINLGQLIGGTVVVEAVFSWPGAGSFIYQAVGASDYPVVQAGVIVIATLFIMINLAVDVIYAFVDPRVRLS